MQKMLLPALSKAETDLACNVGIDPAMGSLYVQGGPKSKPLPNDQKVVLNTIKTCEEAQIYLST